MPRRAHNLLSCHWERSNLAIIEMVQGRSPDFLALCYSSFHSFDHLQASVVLVDPHSKVATHLSAPFLVLEHALH